jgi:hypothetical protein
MRSNCSFHDFLSEHGFRPVRLHFLRWCGGMLLFLWPGLSQATPNADSLVVRWDSAAIEVRRFDEEKLNNFRKDKDFLYDRAEVEAPASLSAWDQFWMWLWQKLLRFIFTERTAVFWKWGIYLLCAGVIAYVILKLTQTNLKGLFSRSPQQSAPAYESADENIHELDFDRLIEEAISQQHYSRAIRLYYLQSLKQLTDRRLIDWRINKTNHDYLYELSRSQPGSPVVPAFSRLTSLFEYICYGNFAVGASYFEEVRGSFQQFNRDVANAKKGA